MCVVCCRYMKVSAQRMSHKQSCALHPTSPRMSASGSRKGLSSRRLAFGAYLRKSIVTASV